MTDEELAAIAERLAMAESEIKVYDAWDPSVYFTHEAVRDISKLLDEIKRLQFFEKAYTTC